MQIDAVVRGPLSTQERERRRQLGYVYIVASQVTELMTALAEVLIEERLQVPDPLLPNQHLCLLKTVMCESVDVARGMLDKDVDVVVPWGNRLFYTDALHISFVLASASKTHTPC
ncbi:hypothetical protein MT418_008157 [Batrachochytrium dendrobatidis]